MDIGTQVYISTHLIHWYEIYMVFDLKRIHYESLTGVFHRYQLHFILVWVLLKSHQALTELYTKETVSIVIILSTDRVRAYKGDNLYWYMCFGLFNRFSNSAAAVEWTFESCVKRQKNKNEMKRNRKSKAKLFDWKKNTWKHTR